MPPPRPSGPTLPPPSRRKVRTRARITFAEGGRVATVRVRLGYVVEDKRGRKRRGEVAQELRLVKAGDRWEISGQRGENMLR